mgnify:CR=1 FL=1
MSMLSVQINELRCMGDGQAAIGNFVIATLLREAADTIESMRDRLQAGACEKRIEQLESLVLFMVPFFESACAHECGCPDGYLDSLEPHDCDGGCRALKELDARLAALGLTEGEGE